MELFPTPAPPLNPPRAPAPEMSGRAFELLTRSQLFAGLPPEMLMDVAVLMRPLSFAAGEAVFRQGTAPDGLYLLEEGEVQLWGKMMDSRQDLVRFQAGQVLCQSALVERSGRLATAECLQPSRIWVLDHRAFEGLCAQLHSTAFALVEAGTRHLSTAMRGALAHFRQVLQHGSAEAASPAPAPRSSRACTAAELPLLRVLPVFKRWPAAALEALISEAKLHEFERGQQLLSEGGAPSGCYFVVRGAIEISTTRNGERARHGLRGPGLLFGYEAFSDGRPQLFDCGAKERTLALELPREALDRHLAARDVLAMGVLTEICGVLSEGFQTAIHGLIRTAGPHASMLASEIVGLAERPST